MSSFSGSGGDPLFSASTSSHDRVRRSNRTSDPLGSGSSDSFRRIRGGGAPFPKSSFSSSSQSFRVNGHGTGISNKATCSLQKLELKVPEGLVDGEALKHWIWSNCQDELFQALVTSVVGDGRSKAPVVVVENDDDQSMTASSQYSSDSKHSTTPPVSFRMTPPPTRQNTIVVEAHSFPLLRSCPRIVQNAVGRCLAALGAFEQ